MKGGRKGRKKRREGGRKGGTCGGWNKVYSPEAQVFECLGPS